MRPIFIQKKHMMMLMPFAEAIQEMSARIDTLETQVGDTMCENLQKEVAYQARRIDAHLTNRPEDIPEPKQESGQDEVKELVYCAPCKHFHFCNTIPNKNNDCALFKPKTPLYTPEQLEILNALYVLGWLKAQYNHTHCTWYLTSKSSMGCSLYHAFGDDVSYNKIRAIFNTSQVDEFDIAKAVNK
jgi:hypothetical protein